jgi:hypothetical protein
MPKNEFIRVEIDPNDPTAYYHNGKLVARRMPSREVIDYRQPLFLNMSPCPYCDGLNDKHEPSKHINTKLGTPVQGGMPVPKKPEPSDDLIRCFTEGE